MTPTPSLAKQRTHVLQQVLEHVDGRQPLLVLKAPPGSGKTHIVMRTVVLAMHRGQRVAVATRTNAQADELCERLGREFPRIPVIRWASDELESLTLGPRITWTSDSKVVATHGACIVVATSTKWATANTPGLFDVMVIDEAWQIAWAEFLPFGSVAARFVLVGDPGQIAPIISVDVSRWETARRPPHRAAPEVILADPHLTPRVLALPVTTRLPHDTAGLVQAFYDFPFASWAQPGERSLHLNASASPNAIDRSLASFARGSVALHTVPMPDAVFVPDDDPVIAQEAAEVVRRLLACGATARLDGTKVTVRPEDIGLTATHRSMNARIEAALGPLAGRVRVDTPERWQGLERLVMVAVHPLSSVTRPSAFDLDTGRLCVMTSRHRVGLVVVSRDHVGDTLARVAPSAEQAVGCRDEAGRGHARNRQAWAWLQARRVAC